MEIITRPNPSNMRTWERAVYSDMDYIANQYDKRVIVTALITAFDINGIDYQYIKRMRETYAELQTATKWDISHQFKNLLTACEYLDYWSYDDRPGKQPTTIEVLTEVFNDYIFDQTRFGGGDEMDDETRCEISEYLANYWPELADTALWRDSLCAPSICVYDDEALAHELEFEGMTLEELTENNMTDTFGDYTIVTWE